jgi:hypothetical protein
MPRGRCWTNSHRMSQRALTLPMGMPSVGGPIDRLASAKRCTTMLTSWRRSRTASPQRRQFATSRTPMKPNRFSRTLGNDGGKRIRPKNANRPARESSICQSRGLAHTVVNRCELPSRDNAASAKWIGMTRQMSIAAGESRSGLGIRATQRNHRKTRRERRPLPRSGLVQPTLYELKMSFVKHENRARYRRPNGSSRERDDRALQMCDCENR